MMVGFGRSAQVDHFSTNLFSQVLSRPFSEYLLKIRTQRVMAEINGELVCFIAPICDSEALDINHGVRHDHEQILIDKDLPSPIHYSTTPSSSLRK